MLASLLAAAAPALASGAAMTPPPLVGTPGTPNCTVHWRDAPLDHFDFSEQRTFKQRYFLYDRYWARPHGPILFYTGNEANVELCAPRLEQQLGAHTCLAPQTLRCLTMRRSLA